MMVKMYGCKREKTVNECLAVYGTWSVTYLWYYHCLISVYMVSFILSHGYRINMKGSFELNEVLRLSGYIYD